MRTYEGLTSKLLADGAQLSLITFPITVVFILEKLSFCQLLIIGGVGKSIPFRISSHSNDR